MWLCTDCTFRNEQAFSCHDVRLLEMCIRDRTYSIPNISVIDSVRNDAAKMGVLFPDDKVLEKCEALKNLGSDADDLYTKYWKKFKS